MRGVAVTARSLYGSVVDRTGLRLPYAANTVMFDVFSNFDIGLQLYRRAFLAYWWDGTPNFGDGLTLDILHWLGVPRVVNVRRSVFDYGPALVGAGSVLDNLSYKSSVVWGSGFIGDAAQHSRGRAPAEVAALRGPLSREIAMDLGWEAPAVFGDPGILAPLLYGSVEKRYQVGIVPHYYHAHLFANTVFPPEIRVIDVRRDPRTVVREIASSRAVISTSLHGIITAHAYGIPWVWATASPPLNGGEFKFRDFMEGCGLAARPIELGASRISPGDIKVMARSSVSSADGGAAVQAQQRNLLSALGASRVLGNRIPGISSVK